MLTRHFKSYLNLNLNANPKISDSLLFVGRNSTFDKNKSITQADLYKNSLRKFMTGRSLQEKLTKIVELINVKGHTIEVIQKSSKGQNFYNFIKEEQKNTNKTDIPNVAFIVRVGKIEDSLVPANSIILTVSFEKDFEVDGGQRQPHIVETLKGIQIINLPEGNYGHSAVISLDKLELVTRFDKSETRLKSRDFSSIAGLKKAFDMYGNTKSKIQLKEQSHFIQKFNDFLKDKEVNKLNAYFINEDQEENVSSLKLEEEKGYSLYTIHSKEISIEPKDRYYIGANNDYSSKVGVTVKKTEELDFEDLINNRIEEQNNFIERNNEIIFENNNEINNLERLLISLNEEASIISVDEKNANIDNENAIEEFNESKISQRKCKSEVNGAKDHLTSSDNDIKDQESFIKKTKTLVIDKEKLVKKTELEKSSLIKKNEKNEAKMDELVVLSEKFKIKKTKLIAENEKHLLEDKSEKLAKKSSGKSKKNIKKDDHFKKAMNEIEKHYKSVKKLEKEIDNINKLIEKCDKTIVFEKDRISKSKQELEEADLNLPDLKVIHKNAEKSLKKLSKELEEVNVVVDEKEITLKTTKNILEEISKKLRDKYSEIKSRKKSISIHKNNIRESQENIEEANARIKEFNEKLDDFFEKDLEFTYVTFSVVSSKRDKMLKSSINVKYSTFLDVALRKETSVYFSDYDAGLNMKFKRFLYTIRAYEFGSYKSPYAALSLEKPDVSIETKEDVISPSINLNEYQQQALNATANAHFSSFLQGPPGTGKTQVIASAVENEVLKGGNVLISSSTNAAINNAMERMNREKANPNIFFLRHSNNIDKIEEAKDFTSHMLYPNFIERLDGFVSLNSKAEEIDLEPIESVTTKRFTKKYLPGNYFSKYISQIKTFDELEYFIKRFDVVEDEDITIAKNEIQEILEYNRRSAMRVDAAKLDDFVTAQSRRVTFEKEDDFNSYLEKLRAFTQSDTSIGEFNKKLRNLSKSFDPKKVPEEKSKSFAKFLFNNSFINVIGITTTSKLSIKLTGGKSERELFVDYPVNFAIIDEISKSVTPEILSVAKLADRFMFAGDYRQLPPTSEISPKLIEEFRQYCLRSERSGVIVDRTIEKLGVNDEKKFADAIEDLLGISLFTNQVNDMKRSKKSHTSYTALRTQYRFNSDINELVNLTYDHNEALVTGRNDKEFNKYEMGIRKLSNSFINIVDTSFISQDYANELNRIKATKEPVQVGQESFDHNAPIFAKRFPYNSKINEYNSYVIVRVLENLKERNAKLFDPKKIGVIAMTRSQAQVIKRDLTRYPGTKNFASQIKIDTVDNFQGQERDVIILDLVRAKGQLSGGKIVYTSRNLEFYRKPERINVAVSRAQSKLIVVGAINDYLSKEVISDVFLDGVSEKISLFEEWKDIVDTRGENISWINY